MNTLERESENYSLSPPAPVHKLDQLCLAVEALMDLWTRDIVRVGGKVFEVNTADTYAVQLQVKTGSGGTAAALALSYLISEPTLITAVQLYSDLTIADNHTVKVGLLPRDGANIALTGLTQALIESVIDESESFLRPSRNSAGVVNFLTGTPSHSPLIPLNRPVIDLPFHLMLGVKGDAALSANTVVATVTCVPLIIANAEEGGANRR